MGEIKRKIKISVVGIILAAAAVLLEIAAMLLFRFDDTGLLYFVAFPLAGVIGSIGCRKLPFKEPLIGWVTLVGILMLFLPFVTGSPAWWFADGAEGLLLFVIGFAVLITFGWLIGLSASKIAEKKPDMAGNKRVLRIIGLTLALVIVTAPIMWMWNLCFGNPVTAYIAGHEMREWVEERAEDGQVYEILDDFLPRYDWYGAEYIFDLAGDGSRWELHWRDGKIRLGSGNW